MTTFYLSGPMTGHPEHNYPLFHEVEHELAEFLSAHLPPEEGWEIVNPARNFGGDRTRERVEYMRLDLQSVLKADVIVLLPGWQGSDGACKEVSLAEWTGKKFWQAERLDFEVEGDGFWGFRIEGVMIRSGVDASPPRAELLTTALGLVTGDRNNQYGPPTADFQRAAGILNALGYQALRGRDIQPHDIAVMVGAVKLSRITWQPEKDDNWIDLAGYAACGWECVTEELARV